MKTYRDLTENQLIDLQRTLTGETANLNRHDYLVELGASAVKDQIAVIDDKGREVLFDVPTDDVSIWVDDDLRFTTNIFLFVRKCAQFGLTY